jgi:alpha-amylase/alpha-mannosidase (GH57 family)
MTVIECVDKGNVGMLTGDITPKLILWLERYIRELNDLITKENTSFKMTKHKRNKFITKFYKKLFKVCSDELFKMPINGIPYPDLENPRNLFER